jgi:hypothetical protein
MLALPLTSPARLARSFVKPQPRANAFRLSPLAKAKGCACVYLADPASIYEGIVGTPNRLAAQSGNTTKPAMGGTAEGHAIQFATNAHYEWGVTINAAPTTELNFSIIARVNPTTLPGAQVQVCSFGKAATSGCTYLGLDTSGHAIAAWFSAGGGQSGTATGSTNWNGKFVTLGGSVNASKNATLYENGAKVVTGTGGAGTDGSLTDPLMTFGTPNTFSFIGGLLWIAAFLQNLSDDEHFLFATRPWLLIEEIPLVSRVGAAAAAATIVNRRTIGPRVGSRSYY